MQQSKDETKKTPDYKNPLGVLAENSGKAEDQCGPEIIHIGSGGAFSESEADIPDEDDSACKTPETPY